MKAWRVLMVCGYVLPSLLTILFGTSEGVVGNFTILSRHSILSQPYPVQHGVRTTVEQSNANLQIECTVCDAGAPTEHCFENHGVCIALSNTAITIIGMDGFLRGMPYSLDFQCTPRYLQRVDVGMVVVCRESCFHLVTRTGSTFEVYPAECGIGQGGIVVEANFHGYPSLFLIELEGNHISESNPYAAIPISDITPHNNCTEYLSLYPLYDQEHFMLWCNTTTGERVHVVNRSNRSDAPFVELSSPPISSPDGRTFAAVTGSILKLYRSNYLQQYPGVKDFGADITLCTYLNSATLLVGLDGGGQMLVHVETFIDSVGVEGLTTLPYTSSNSRVHKLVSQDVYATTNHTGNLYNVLLFNITSGQALDPISALLEKPVNIFFRHGVAPDPPPMADMPLTPDQLRDQLPTSHSSPTTSYTLPALTSTHPTETSPTPETTDLPKPSPSHQFPKEVGFTIGVFFFVTLTFLGIVTVICFKCHFSKRKEKRRCRLSKPMEETGEKTGGTSADKSSVGSDFSSSGIGTAPQSFTGFAPDEDDYSLGSGCGNSQNYFYTEPLPESGHS